MVGSRVQNNMLVLQPSLLPSPLLWISGFRRTLPLLDVWIKVEPANVHVEHLASGVLTGSRT
jgi:hypothetical protein